MLGYSSSRQRGAPPGARTLYRFPFVQEPASTTLVNTERLPEDLKDTELGYRAQAISDQEAQVYARGYVLKGLIFGPSLLYLLVILPLFLPYSFLFVVAGSVLATIARSLLLGERRSYVIKRTFLLPVAAAAAGEAVRWALGIPIANAALRVIAFVAATMLAFGLYFDSDGPFSFIWSWRVNHQAIPAKKSRSYSKKGGFLGLGAFRAEGLSKREKLGAYGLPLLAAALLLLGGLLVFRFAFLEQQDFSDIWLLESKHVFGGEDSTGPMELAALVLFWLATLLPVLWHLRKDGYAARGLGHYLTYDGSSSGAPGVWMAAGSLRQRRRLLPWFMVAVSLTAFSFDGFLLPAYGKDSAYFSSFYDLKKADLAVETADRMNAPSAPEVQAPRVETPTELVIPPEAASSLEKMSEYLRGKSTARQQATAQTAPEKRPAKIADAVYSAEATDSDSFKWLADRFGASVAALNNRVSSFLWLMGLSFLLVTPWLCLFLLPLFYYNEKVAELVNERTVFEETRTNWQQFVDRVRSSSFVAFDPLSYNKVREADHLFLGIEPSANFPVLLDQKLLSEHTYIVGDSGSGKTSLGIMPIVKQLMNESATNSEKTPFLILDLKGDNALFQMVREIAAKRDQKFLFFTPEKDRASHHFNPFEDFDLSTRTLSSFCTLFLDALSLNHGEGYGRGYFTARNRLLLYSVLQEHNPQSFAQLNDELAKLRGPAREEAFELVAAMQMLGSYENLNTFGPDRTRMPAERTIQMRRLIEKQEVAYFWLPAAIESISVREIGKLALFSLISAAITRQRAGLPVQRVYVVIDEFQRLAGENFSIVLEQARSFGISLILANQTISDLNTPSKDLRPSIRTNTRVKFFFSVTEPEELRSISSVSGLELVETRTRSTTAGHKGFFASNTETESRTEQFAPRLAAQDIQRVSDHPSEFLLQVSRGSGFTQFAGLPVPVRTEWPMSESEYKRLSSLPWPELPATSQERTREGLSAEMVPVKERDRAFLAEAETWKARIAADAFGYAELRFVDPPSADPAQEKREATLRNLFEEGERP